MTPTTNLGLRLHLQTRVLFGYFFGSFKNLLPRRINRPAREAAFSQKPGIFLGTLERPRFRWSSSSRDPWWSRGARLADWVTWTRCPGSWELAWNDPKLRRSEVWILQLSKVKTQLGLGSGTCMSNSTPCFSGVGVGSRSSESIRNGFTCSRTR